MVLAILNLKEKGLRAEISWKPLTSVSQSIGKGSQPGGFTEEQVCGEAFGVRTFRAHGLGSVRKCASAGRKRIPAWGQGRRKECQVIGPDVGGGGCT